MKPCFSGRFGSFSFRDPTMFPKFTVHVSSSATFMGRSWVIYTESPQVQTGKTLRVPRMWPCFWLMRKQWQSLRLAANCGWSRCKHCLNNWTYTVQMTAAQYKHCFDPYSASLSLPICKLGQRCLPLMLLKNNHGTFIIVPETGWAPNQ